MPRMRRLAGTLAGALALLGAGPVAAQEPVPARIARPVCPNYQEVTAGFPYPREALSNGVEGEVVVDVVLEPDGKVRSAEIAWTTSMEFDDVSMRRIVRKLRCSPPGRVTRVRIPIDFRLANEEVPPRARGAKTRHPAPSTPAEEMEAMLAYAGRRIMRAPDEAEPYARRAALLQQKGDFAAALADASSALKIRPDHVGALFLRAALRRLTGDLGGSLADHDRLVALDPQRANVHFSRAYTLYALADFAGAAAALARGFDVAGADDRTDFPRLVQYVVRRRSGEKAPEATAALAAALPAMDEWPAALASMLLGKRPVASVLQLAEKGADEKVRKGRRCEAHFYAGALKLVERDPHAAAAHLRASLAENIPDFIETGFARADLDRLRTGR